MQRRIKSQLSGISSACAVCLVLANLHLQLENDWPVGFQIRCKFHNEYNETFMIRHKYNVFLRIQLGSKFCPRASWISEALTTCRRWQSGARSKLFCCLVKEALSRLHVSVVRWSPLRFVLRESQLHLSRQALSRLQVFGKSTFGVEVRWGCLRWTSTLFIEGSPKPFACFLCCLEVRWGLFWMNLNSI